MARFLGETGASFLCLPCIGHSKTSPKSETTRICSSLTFFFLSIIPFFFSYIYIYIWLSKCIITYKWRIRSSIYTNYFSEHTIKLGTGIDIHHPWTSIPYARDGKAFFFGTKCLMLLKACACEVCSYCIQVATATNDIGQGTYDMIGLMILP